ncbi:EAL domain-containing protein [Metabacillus sp. GX 13764]|uniref:EAL domain-containing protein n=1 Tax=Metabacillus kandeliae TaxID=2900151 RepID=UPI001E2C654B|nr:EAL domain-containing protein [Metabacillus kandeliae]MCD7036117.1 EAL domain-containing protein [Metabacillus kandeliae]
MEQCHMCFQPARTGEEGILAIKGEETKGVFSSSGFSAHIPGYFTKKYGTRSELKKTLSQLDSEINLAPYDAALGGREADLKALPLLPLQTIYSQVIHKDTVDVILHGDLVSYLQPIISLQNEEIFGYESLLRTGGGISPGELFTIAQQTHTHSFLDKRAREQAIIAKKERIEDGKKVFINFLPSTIYNPDYCLRHTFHLVEKYGISPDDLVFEVVETEKIADIDHLKRILDTYRKNGMKVALDDLGAGFSTPEVLKDLRPDFVKIDRHYIDGCDASNEKQNFIKKVAALSDSLGITVLAEGIETKMEYDFLRAFGISLGQGYYIGKPALKPAPFPAA